MKPLLLSFRHCTRSRAGHVGWVALVIASLSRPVSAQVMEIRSATPLPSAATLNELKLRQQGFESFRRLNIPSMGLGRGGGNGCDERIGRFCYWYDEEGEAPPPEPSSIAQARLKLIAGLDSATRASPAERWLSGALVRYLVEADKPGEALKAAERCETNGWWCHALRGFAHHAAGSLAPADSAWNRALAAMDERTRCEWRDLKLVLDDGLLREYRAAECQARQAQEERVWWLSRPMMASSGNDARSEWYARRLYALFIEEAPTIHTQGFDPDERELMLRYGWPRAWTQTRTYIQGAGNQALITGHEPVPAPPMNPTAATVRNPAYSDSVGWRGKGLPGVRARYSPLYARRLLPLTHQSAIFRRGDSALVVMAYDVSRVGSLSQRARTDKLSAALVLTRGEESDAAVVRVERPEARGVITARTAWGPMLMSAEVSAPDTSTLARARYGIRATDTPGSRVAISDLLLFDPYFDMPRTLEDVLPHARATQVVERGAKVGIYWETYNTSPVGEGIQVAITVAPEETEGNWLRRRLTSLKLVREAQPVTVGLADQSARGRAFTPRAVVVDLATLRPGRYLMQLEITAQGTPPVRAERVLTVR